MTVYKDDMGQRDTPQGGFPYLNCYSGKYQGPLGWVGLWNALQPANVGFESWKQTCGSKMVPDLCKNILPELF